MESSMTSLESDAREAVAGLGRMWWIWLVVGALWIAAAYVILQFDNASIATIGVIAGIMFVVLGVQNFVMAALVESWGWLWALFGVLLVIGGVVSFISPENTFAALADILGFIFLMIGTFWLIAALATREENSLWWLGLTSGILMLIMAFWAAGQFWVEKAYVLLVFAGIWALMQGITDIVRAFQFRRLRDLA